MNKMLQVIIMFVMLSLPAVICAGDYIDAVKKGNEAYNSADYKAALEQYHIAEADIPESAELDYNMAGALYQQGSYEETVEKFTRALNTTDIDLEARAHYNLGNTYYRMGDYPNAIKSYENALNLNPEDTEAKFNLELARKMLKEQTKPEQQDQQQQQQQQQQEQQQQQQDQQEEDEQEQQQQPQNEEQQEEDQQEQQPQPQDEKEMSKEDAERILNALKDDEQEVQEKIKRQKARGDYVGKDW